MDVDDIQSTLDDHFSPLGFECHPFLIGWYNSKVNPKFELDEDENTLAFVVLSQPSMFEKSFLPFVKQTVLESNNKESPWIGDPLDACMRQTFDSIRKYFPDNYQLDILHDFQLRPNRRPKVLVQTAAHVSGAVRFYRPSDVTDINLSQTIATSKVYSVCVHPKFGGWFAIRGVIVFKNIIKPNLKVPQCSVNLNQEQIVKLLKLYNECWQDWSFRDILENKTKERYSDLQKLYFSTKPADRLSIINKFITM